jgi:hypothetical protein
VVGPTDALGVRFTSGVVLYHVRAGEIDGGTFIPLDPKPAPVQAAPKPAKGPGSTDR